MTSETPQDQPTEQQGDAEFDPQELEDDPAYAGGGGGEDVPDELDDLRGG